MIYRRCCIDKSGQITYHWWSTFVAWGQRPSCGSPCCENFAIGKCALWKHLQGSV